MQIILYLCMKKILDKLTQTKSAAVIDDIFLIISALKPSHAVTKKTKEFYSGQHRCNKEILDI